MPLERRSYDIMKGETRTPEFLRDVSANSRIPVLQDGDRFLTESSAICFYLANGSKLIPTAISTRPTCCAGCSGSNIITNRTSPRCATGFAMVGLDALIDARRMQISPEARGRRSPRST